MNAQSHADSFSAYMRNAYANYEQIVEGLRALELDAHFTQTGGGCLAIEILFPGDPDRHLLLTDEEGPLPFEASDVTGWHLGYYGPENAFGDSCHPEEFGDRDYASCKGTDLDEIAALAQELASRPRFGDPAHVADGFPEPAFADYGDDFEGYANAFQSAYAAKVAALFGPTGGNPDLVGEAQNLLICDAGLENLEDFGPKEVAAAAAALHIFDAIRQDIAEDVLPAVRSFSETHDHVDGNDYLISFLEAAGWNYSPASDWQTAVLNLAGEYVDLLLARQ